MRKSLAVLVVVLAVPGLAIAAKPPAPGKSQDVHGQSAVKVLYVLKGTLSAYTSPKPGPGSITIQIKKANHYRAFLKTDPATSVTFSLPSTTRVVIHKHGSTIADGDVGIVKVKAAKVVAGAATATVVAALQAGTVTMVVDQHAAKS